MAVLKQCKSKGCKASPRCEHPWWFDLMHKGRRYRMPVDAGHQISGRRMVVVSDPTREPEAEEEAASETVTARDQRLG